MSALEDWNDTLACRSVSLGEDVVCELERTIDKLVDAMKEMESVCNTVKGYEGSKGQIYYSSLIAEPNDPVKS